MNIKNDLLFLSSSFDNISKKIKCWEDINSINGAYILDDDEKKYIFKKYFLEFCDYEKFSFYSIPLSIEKVRFLILTTNFFEVIFDGKNFRDIEFRYIFFETKLTSKIINIFKKSIVKNISFYDFFNFDDDLIYIIGDFIKKSHSIKSLCIKNSNLTNHHIKILSQCLAKNGIIKSLSFKKCKFLTNDCNNYLIEILNETLIDYINFDESNITNISTLEPLLINNFFKNKNKVIIFEDQGINDNTLNFLSDSIIKNNVNFIEVIDISRNKITSKGISILFKSLFESKNENIKLIHIQQSNLDDSFIVDLGKIIKQNKNIIVIDLSNINISDNGIEILSEYIVGNTSIRSLYLCGNKGITNKSYSEIIYMLETSYIMNMNVDFTEISKTNLIKIKEHSEIPIEERKRNSFVYNQRC